MALFAARLCRLPKQELCISGMPLTERLRVGEQAREWSIVCTAIGAVLSMEPPSYY